MKKLITCLTIFLITVFAGGSVKANTVVEIRTPTVVLSGTNFCATEDITISISDLVFHSSHYAIGSNPREVDASYTLRLGNRILFEDRYARRYSSNSSSRTERLNDRQLTFSIIEMLRNSGINILSPNTTVTLTLDLSFGTFFGGTVSEWRWTHRRIEVPFTINTPPGGTITATANIPGLAFINREYFIYETSLAALNNNIQILSTTAPSLFNRVEFLRANGVNTNFSSVAPFATFTNNNNPNIGATTITGLGLGATNYTGRAHIRRTGSAHGIETHSNTLTFRVAPRLMLGALRQTGEENRVNFVCGNDTFFTLQGGFLNSTSSSHLPVASYFEDGIIRFHWEFRRASGGSWQAVPDHAISFPHNNTNSNINIRTDFLTEKTYFRQVVHATSFGVQVRNANVGHLGDWRTFHIFERRAAINANDFVVTQVGSTFCHNQAIPSGQGQINITVNPTSSVSLESLTFAWARATGVVNNNTVGTPMPGVTGTSYTHTEPITENTTYIITVTDECGATVRLTAELRVNPRPVLTKNMINFIPQTEDLTPNITNRITIERLLDSPEPLRLNIAAGSGYTILYNRQSTPTFPRVITPGWVVNITELADDLRTYGANAVFITKINTNTGCVSEPIFLELRGINPIGNNIILPATGSFTTIDGVRTLSVCPGSSSVQMNGTDPTGYAAVLLKVSAELTIYVCLQEARTVHIAGFTASKVMKHGYL